MDLLKKVGMKTISIRQVNGEMIIMARIPVAPVGRIIKESGAERVSEDAKVALEAYLEEKAEEISRESIKLAALAKRKTVKAEDIELAIKNL